MSTSQGNGIAAVSAYLTDVLIPSITTIRVQNIFDHELTDLAGFPAATITVTEVQGKVIDNTRNERVWKFTVRIFIDRNVKNFGVDKSETILRNVADELILKVDADPTLGGNVIDTIPGQAKFGYIDRENNNIRLMEVTLDCRDAVTWR